MFLKKNKSTALSTKVVNEREMQANELEFKSGVYETEYNELAKISRKWKTLDIIALIILIILLLYSVTTVVVTTIYNTKKFQIDLTAQPIVIDEKLVSTMTSEEILKESEKNGYVANTMEYYFDGAEIYRVNSDDTEYKSIDEMQSQVIGQPVIYDLGKVRPIKNPDTSITKVANQKFTYGWMDGSSQMAISDTTKLKWSGYSQALIDKYMSTIKPVDIRKKTAAIVIYDRFDVTDEFIEAMLDGIIVDNYMANNTNIEDYYNVKNDYKTEDAWFGFKKEKKNLFYITSHGVSEGILQEKDKESLDRQIIVKLPVLDKMKANIEDYLGKEVKVSSNIPLLVNEPITVIYLRTDNVAADSWYILANQK